MKYKYGDILDVPFPFVDRPVKKRRPALVLSDRITGDGHEILVMAMLTSAKRAHWNHDVEIADWKSAGLRGPSILRWKLFSLDSSLVLDHRGSVSKRDKLRIADSFASVFAGLV